MSSRDDAEEIDVEELKHRLDGGDPPVVLDVRNPPEVAICRLDGSLFIPLPELAQRLGELDQSRETVVLCRSGVRSAWAVAFLRAQGFPRVRNVTGGILAWADRIDPTMTQY